jgi:hypothetical protein
MKIKTEIFRPTFRLILVQFYFPNHGFKELLNDYFRHFKYIMLKNKIKILWGFDIWINKIPLIKLFILINIIWIIIFFVAR